jgi:hypothetical protein
MPPYKRLNLERIVTADWILPSDEPPTHAEAMPEPLFPDEDEARAIIEAEHAEATA